MSQDKPTDVDTPVFRTGVDVELIKCDASDADVVRAARVSTQGTDQTEPGSVDGLIRYLMRSRHGSPFEHNVFTFAVCAPIFVFREFQRHRVWSYNEESARYRKLRPVFYLPGPDRPLVQIGKPGHYRFEPGDELQHRIADREMRWAYKAAYNAYSSMIESGIAREVARSVLPVGIYSSMYATCNARALMHFLSLRTNDPRARVPSHPQYEIEQVARKIEDLFAQAMPITYAAFCDAGRVAP